MYFWRLILLTRHISQPLKNHVHPTRMDVLSGDSNVEKANNSGMVSSPHSPLPWSARNSPNNLPSPLKLFGSFLHSCWMLIFHDLFALQSRLFFGWFPQCNSSGHAPSLSCQVQGESRQHGRQGDTLDGEKHLRIFNGPTFFSRSLKMWGQHLDPPSIRVFFLG